MLIQLHNEETFKSFFHLIDIELGYTILDYYARLLQISYIICKIWFSRKYQVSLTMPYYFLLPIEFYATCRKQKI